MELIAQFVLTYAIGWSMGFVTVLLLLWVELRKPVPVKVERTNVRDLYPPERRN